MGLDKNSSDVLLRTTQILRSGSDADIKRLRQYLTKFKIEKNDSVEISEGNFEKITHLLKMLRNSKSSHEAVEILNAQSPSKSFLLMLSREIGLPIVKSDRLEHLKLRIIHELVETRLNSEAIRNPNLMRKPE